MAVKTMEMSTRPRITGRTPLWPARSRVSQARNHSPSDWATISGGTSTTAAWAEAVGSSGASARAMLALFVAGLRRPAVSAGRHVLDHALAVKARGSILRHHPAQVQDGDPIGDLEHIVEVVRDDHHGEATITQAPHHVQHHLG